MERLPIKSSNIVSAAFDPATQTVEVEFRSGGIYQSAKPVPPEEWQAWAATFQADDSSGRYFHTKMKQYEFKKVEPEEKTP